MTPPPPIICSSEQELVDRLGKLVEKTAAESIRRNGCFKLGLSGGSLVKFLCTGLPHITSEWTKWKIFFCDERLVSFDSAESTFGNYKRDLLHLVPLSETQCVVINPELDVKSAADDYCQKLKEYFPSCDLPKFDLLLLGIGPDGHTCSLFPNHQLLKEKKWVGAISDSPKPPPCRITLTLPVINNSCCIAFAATGASKGKIIKEIFDGNCEIPAALVQPCSGEIYWFLDKEAAKSL